MKKNTAPKVSLNSFMARIRYPEMNYVMATAEFYETCEINETKLNEYKDYLKMPYIKQEDIYTMFLDYKGLKKEKKELNATSDFGVAFRYFIDSNKKYGHSLYSEYLNFEKDILKPIAIEWCEKNKIPYIDDCRYVLPTL